MRQLIESDLCGSKVNGLKDNGLLIDANYERNSLWRSRFPISLLSA